MAMSIEALGAVAKERRANELEDTVGALRARVKDLSARVSALEAKEAALVEAMTALVKEAGKFLSRRKA